MTQRLEQFKWQTVSGDPISAGDIVATPVDGIIVQQTLTPTATPTATPSATPTITPTITPTPTPVVQHTLTVIATGGGDVTEPVEPSTIYDKGTVVDLLAASEPGYCFVRWTGDVGTVADVWAPDTAVTMNGDYSITANFTDQATIWDVFGAITAYCNFETSIWSVFRIICCYAG